MNRKQFFKIILSSFVLFLLYLWEKLTTDISLTQLKNKQVILPNNFSNGIHLLNDLIVIKDDEKIKILSSRCSHLGCRINNIIDEILICPCHGSRFDLNGKPVQGPATNSLTELKFNIDSSKNQIIIFS